MENTSGFPLFTRISATTLELKLLIGVRRLVPRLDHSVPDTLLLTGVPTLGLRDSITLYLAMTQLVFIFNATVDKTTLGLRLFYQWRTRGDISISNTITKLLWD